MKTATKKQTKGTAEMVVKMDTKLVLVSELNTRQPTEKEVAELKKSIKAHGQATPALARPHPTKKGCVELAAGARRRTACHALGIPLDVIVRPMTDGELEDTILLENLQREDPDPEAEAVLIGRRLAEGLTPGEICARYGKTELWVKRRMKLLDIVPELMALMKPGQPLDHFNVEMKERVGSLSPEMQIRAAGNWNFRNAGSFASLQEAIRGLASPLEGCDWLTDPDTFIPGCGPGCATDTNDSLFKEAGKSCGNCLNAICFGKRLGMAIDKAITAALGERKITDVVLFKSEGYGGAIYEGKELKVMDRWDFSDSYSVSKAKAGTELAGLDVSKPMAPKLVFLIKKKAGGKNAPSGSPGQIESREDRLTGKRLAAMNKLLVEAICAADVPAGVPILNLVAAFGMTDQRNYLSNLKDHEAVWLSLDAEVLVPEFGHGGGNLTREELLWESIRPILKGRIYFGTNRDLVRPDKMAEMQAIAGLIGFDWQSEWIRVCTDELPVPKSWGKGIDPITLAKDEPPAAAPEAVETKVAPLPKKTAAKAVKKTAKKAAKKARKLAA